MSSATLTIQGTNLDSRIEVAAAKLADVDRRISAIDGIVAGAAQRGRANTATSIMSDQRKARAATFADLISSRIVVRGPKLRLNAAFAQAMGLALHELTTNVGKYGALSKDTGHVDIGWGTDCDIFAMSWTECDGPAVSAPQRRGFGTVFMAQMTECSVDRRGDLEYAPSGVTWPFDYRTSEPVPKSSDSRCRTDGSRQDY